MDLKFGWLKEPDDPRDYTEQNIQTKKPEFARLKLPFFKQEKVINNDRYVIKGVYQERSDCVAHTGYHLVGFICKKIFGKDVKISRKHLYYLLRFLMLNDEKPVNSEIIYPSEDTGGWIRKMIQSISLGIVPEDYIRYVADKYNEKPDPYLVAQFAGSYKALKAIKLDYPGIDREELIVSMKKWCEAGWPIAFGTLLGKSYYDSFENGGIIKAPNFLKEGIPIGAHAMMIPAGFNENTKRFRLQNSHPGFGDEKGLGYIDEDVFRMKRNQKPIAQDVWVGIDYQALIKEQFD